MSTRHDRRRAAIAEHREAVLALVRSDGEDRAAGRTGETAGFLAANRRVYAAEQQLPWWWRAYLSNAWRLPWFYLRHPMHAWRTR